MDKITTQKILSAATKINAIIKSLEEDIGYTAIIIQSHNPTKVKIIALVNLRDIRQNTKNKGNKIRQN